jgi:palmitoyltransferase
MWQWAYIGAAKIGPGASWGALVSQQGGYCDKCQMNRVARSHHCQRCNICSLKMDHHCPWVSNCVGFNNYKHFVLFIFYLSLGTFTYCYLLHKYFMGFWYHNKTYTSNFLESGVFIVESAIVFLTMFAVPSLFATHVGMTLSNVTTLEFMRGVPVKIPCKRAHSVEN